VTLREMLCVDSVGLPKFEERRAQAMVNLVKKERRLESEPPPCEGRGIVIAGGGKYLSWAYVLCRWLRHLRCDLPIMVAHMGDKEMPRNAVPLFSKLGATPWDAYQEMKRNPLRQMSGWILKNYAVTHAPWETVMFLDADAFPYRDPVPLFDAVKDTGGLFFSDVANYRPHDWGYQYCGLQPQPMEWEAGQYLFNKRLGWMGLRWASWLNEHTDVWFKTGHGDKHTLMLGVRMSGIPHLLSTDAVWSGWGIRQRYDGQDWVAHAMAYKRKESEPPFPEIGHFFKEWESMRIA
jgi:hypothetical protein